MNKKILFGIIGVGVVIVIVILFLLLKNNTQISNPAAEYCIENNGEYQIKSNSYGEYGICKFKDHSECEEWQYYRGTCMKGEHIVSPDLICTQEYDPVCGVNGITYPNPCHAGEAHIAYKGECILEEEEKVVCTEEYDPVCGVDGVTYSNSCYAEAEDIEVAYKGECEEDTFCTEEYDPVCGVDGITYSNSCYAEVEDVEVAYKGECNSEDNLLEKHINHCIDQDGLPEERYTEQYEYYVCVFSDNSECSVELLYESECLVGQYIVDHDMMCTMEYNPVCAINGVTYSNPCFAGDIPIVSEGICQK